MTFFMSSHKAFDPLREASGPPPLWLNGPSEPSKAYHATGAWGKRGMTLQELTRAFEAFNEDEERVAIGFAGSEDCNRRLAEPLSEVKTVFSDLDGLKAPSRCSAFSSSCSLSFASRRISSPIPHVYPDPDAATIHELGTNELGYVIQAPDVNTGPSTSDTHLERAIGLDGGVDEDTIKPSHKRRRSLSAISPLETASLSEPPSEPEDNLETNRWDLPPRPPSRLGFIDRGVNDDEEEDSSRN